MINYLPKPAVIPYELKLIHFNEYMTSSVAVLSEHADQSLHLSPMISDSLPWCERSAVLNVISKYASVFNFSSKEKLSLIPPCCTAHSINTGSLQPIRQKPYRVSPSKRRLINEEVQDMLAKGVIRESYSPWVAPVILLRKKD